MKNKNHEHVNQHYIGKPTISNDEFLRSRTIQQVIMDYSNGKKDQTALKNL